MAMLALFPKDDHRQAHRIRRYLFALGSSVLAWLLLFLLYWEGYLEETGLIYTTSGMLFFLVLFYALFRSGLNLKVRDPSLTVEMMESSIVVLTCAMYYASPGGRGVIVLLLPFTFLFGLFRLGTRDLLGVGGFALICYGAMTLLLLHFRSGTIDLQLTLLRWAVLAAVFVWFAFMGGYIGRMRKQLALSKSDLEKAFHALQELATHDELTGVHNRRHLMEMLRHEKSRCARTGATFCISVLDLDFFKQINDKYGHQAGDDVLRGFSRNAKQRMRTTDYFGRYGGEEFLLILTDTSLEGARIGAERVRRDAEQLSFVEIGPDLRISVSIGLAQHQAGEEIEQTLQRADSALYRAKEAGRNRVET
ncbi:MAG TPA: GGDEF domain-containing protein [Burkholderiales bacterium]